MIVYAGKRFTASLLLTRPADVACEKCGCQFRYQLVRRGTGYASAPYYIGQAGAQRRATANATKAAARKLKTGIEAVICPGCGWIQAKMVNELRRRRARPLLYTAWIVPPLTIIVALIIASEETHGFNWSLSDLPANELMPLLLLCLGTALVPMISIGLRIWLQKRVNPNHAYPDRPDPIPGAPPAVIRNVDGSAAPDTDLVPVEVIDESTLGYERRSPEVQPGGWVTVQLLNLTFPRSCVKCMQPSNLVAYSRINSSAPKVRIPICTECDRSIKRGRFVWALCAGALGAVPGILLFLLASASDVANSGIVLAIVFSIIFAIGGWLTHTNVSSPIRFRRYSGDRNTVEIRFINSSYTDDFLAVNRAVATAVVARSLGSGPAVISAPPLGNGG